MIRFCDKEVCCVSCEELDRGMLLNWFFQGNIDEMVCVVNADGTYQGRITYYSLINSDKIQEAVLEDCVVLNKDFRENARNLLAGYERSFREHVLFPVVDEENKLISFAYEDTEANREMRMLRELEELSGAISFADIYPQYDCVKICGFNELALCFAEYLRGQNICVETDGELWERFFDGGKKVEVPDYRCLVIYAEGVRGRQMENWVENLLRSVSPEFECIDHIYEANWEAGMIRDTDTDLAGLLDNLRKTDREIAILGADLKAQNAYNFLLGNGIEAGCFISDIFEERQHLLFGKKVLKSAEIRTQRGKRIILECWEEHSALGFPVLEDYSYLGFQRNNDFFLLRDYVEVPYDNLIHVLQKQRLLFVGDIFLCERIAGYLKKNVEEMYFADILNENILDGVCENTILQQVELGDVDKDILCLIVLPEFAGGPESKIITANRKRRQDIIRALRENEIWNYTDYFSYRRTFAALERDIPKRGFYKERLRPKRIVLGAIEHHSGNSLIRGLLDNHPSVLMMSNFNLFDNNLFWFCVQLAGAQAETILSLLKNMYQLQDIGLCNMEAFEKKLGELLESKETYTSQELFVIFMISYVYMYGQNIDDVRDMVIYWEPHNIARENKEKFVEWMGMAGTACCILNVFRNRCMLNGSTIREDIEHVKLETLLQNSLSYSDISKVDQEDSDRYIIRFEDLKRKPRETLSELCRQWEIPWSETLMEATEYGKKAGYVLGNEAIYDFDLKPVYNNYEEYFSSFDRFRITLICAPWQKKFGYPYVRTTSFSRRELQEMFLKEFRLEKRISDNGEKGKLDRKIRLQEQIRKDLWENRKLELLEKHSEKNDGNK